MTLELEDDMPGIAQYKNCRAYLDHLAERMDRYGITQKQLSKEVRVAPAQTSRWFRKGEGGVDPSSDTVFEMERAFQKLKREKIAKKMASK